jgi:hypothetical protein
VQALEHAERPLCMAHIEPGTVVADGVQPLASRQASSEQRN